MASNGKNGVGKPGRSTTKDSDMGANDKEEKKDLSGSEQVEKEGKTPVTDDNGGKTPSAEPVEEEVGDELQDVLKPLGGDITEVLLAKRRRLEMNTSAAIDISKEKIENVWKTQKEQREDLTMKCSQQFLTLFQQWDIDVQKAKEHEEHLTNLFRQQQNVFQQFRTIQDQRLERIKVMYEQFVKSLQDLESSHERVFSDTYSELKKELALLQKKMLMETQQQEIAIVRESLQSLLNADDSSKKEQK